MPRLSFGMIGKSFIKMENNSKLKMLPCGTELILDFEDIKFLI